LGPTSLDNEIALIMANMAQVRVVVVVVVVVVIVVMIIVVINC